MQNHSFQLRHYQQQTNADNYHPSYTARVLLFLIPTAFFFIISLMITRRSIDVTNYYRVYTLPKNGALMVLSSVYLLITLIIGGYAFFQDAWRINQWVIYGYICMFQTIGHILYASTYKLGRKALVASSIFGIISLVCSQWLFIQLSDMRQDKYYNHDMWKVILRFFQGLRTTFILFQTFQLISQSLVHVFDVRHINQILFFWISSLVLLISLVIVNIIYYGPIIHVLGFVLGAIMYMIPAVKHTYLYFQENQGK